VKCRGLGAAIKDMMRNHGLLPRTFCLLAPAQIVILVLIPGESGQESLWKHEIHSLTRRLAAARLLLQ